MVSRKCLSLFSLFLFSTTTLIAGGLSGPRIDPGTSNTYKRAADFKDQFKNCDASTVASYQKCFEKREERKLPYKLVHEEGRKTEYVALLLHGLSDGPYLMKDVAYELYKMGMNVIVPLHSGHGTHNFHHTQTGLDRNNDVANNDNSNKSENHWIRDLRDFYVPEANKLGEKIIAGGLSMGGLLATNLTLHPELAEGDADIAALILFSPLLEHIYDINGVGACVIDKNSSRKYQENPSIENGYDLFTSGFEYNGGGASFRYMFMGWRGVCSASHIIWKTDALKHAKSISAQNSVPVFGVLTEYDSAVSKSDFIEFMEKSDDEGKRKNHMFAFITSDDDTRYGKFKNRSWWTIHSREGKYLDHAGVVLKDSQFNRNYTVRNSATHLEDDSHVIGYGNILNSDFDPMMNSLKSWLKNKFPSLK